MALRLLTAGESHGKGIVFILEGIPRGLKVERAYLEKELRRRRWGYGRSARMKLEKDNFEVISGLRFGKTTGNPISFLIPNVEHSNWRKTLNPWNKSEAKQISLPRPGHADLAGALKFYEVKHGRLSPADIRDVMERASARECVARVLAGAVCKLLLGELSIHIRSFVYQIGNVGLRKDTLRKLLSVKDIHNFPDELVESDPLRMPHPATSKKACEEVDKARRLGTTLGGGFAVIATGIPPGLGSFTMWDRRLDGRIAQAIMSIPAVKSVSFGQILWAFSRYGKDFQDEIVRARDSLTHTSNLSGGITGGTTNGMPIVVTALMKPLPTQAKGLRSVDLKGGRAGRASVHRHDITSVPSACVIAEHVLAFILADEVMRCYGGDHITVVKERFQLFKSRVEAMFREQG